MESRCSNCTTADRLRRTGFTTLEVARAHHKSNVLIGIVLYESCIHCYVWFDGVPTSKLGCDHLNPGNAAD